MDIGIFLIVGLVALLMAVVATRNRKSWVWLPVSLFLSFFGILLPLIVFFLSVLLVPGSKSGAFHGWVDCFHETKVSLTPVVLWACAALYACDIYGVEKRTRAWIVLGVWSGAVVSSICFLYGVAVNASPSEFRAFLLVPLYTAIWFGWRAWELSKAASLPAKAYGWTFLGMLPFWLHAIMKAHERYVALPDNPECFVVTAASRGHASWVGPFVEVIHRGQPRRVNRQLAALWAFEAFWRERAPFSHRMFRSVYNRIGPIVARRISSPWLADAVFVVIKPVEWLARMVVARGR